MKIGYFKLPPVAKNKQLSERSNLLSLPSGQKNILSKLATPIILSLLVPVIFVFGIQFGYNSAEKIMANNDVYKPISSLSLPATVSFVPSIANSLTLQFGTLIDYVADLAYQIRDRWSSFFFPDLVSEKEPVAVDIEVLREQIKAEVMEQLSNQAGGNIVKNNGQSYGVVVSSTSEPVATIETLKTDLPRLFADKVKVRFSADGLSGKITPVFRDIGDGKDYVFVLNPISSN